MFVKKFEAPTFEKAIALVKEEMGPEALILSTQEKAKKLFQKPFIEITAAAKQKEKKTPVKAESESRKSAFNEANLKKVFPHRKESFEKPHTKSIRKADVSRYGDVTAGTHYAGKYEVLLKGFLKLGISPEYAKEFSRNLVFDYTAEDLSNPRFLERVQLKLMKESLKTLEPRIFDAKSSWVVLGAAGSGKTSLLIKLGIYLKKQGKSIGLKTFDRRKMLGATELAAYARLCQIPFYIESESKKFSENIQLCDSPSLTLKDEGQWGELEAVCRNRSVLLVLDATSRLAELTAIIKAASNFHPAAIAFTRLDMVCDYGVIFDVIKETKLPLMGFSVDQSFRPPFSFLKPNKLAELILKRGKTCVR